MLCQKTLKKLFNKSKKAIKVNNPNRAICKKTTIFCTYFKKITYLCTRYSRNMDKDIYILGIESSCDDTSAAVLKNGVLLSNVTASQAVHESYGGVVPELASRAHQQNVVPVVHEAIKRAGITKEQLSAVAFTRGPGLMGSLLVGVNFAKGFARSRTSR